MVNPENSISSSKTTDALASSVVDEEKDDGENQDDETDEQSDEEILEQAKQEYNICQEAWSKVYEAALEDMKFIAGEQWDLKDVNARKQKGRPCLTINRLPQFINQVVNEQRQSRPAVKVSPVDDNADVETAKIYQNMIRGIERASNADAAYDKAFENAASGGIGFFRLRTDYASTTSFKQEILFDRIPDPTLVKIDPFYQQPDASDINYAFVESTYSKDEFKQEFPNSKIKDYKDFDGFIVTAPDWFRDNSIRVCEYFKRTFEEITLIQLSDGSEHVESEVEATLSKQYPDGVPADLKVTNKRKSHICKINHYKLNGCEILERSVFPGSYIPIIAVFGKELIIEGERILESIIRHAKDSQRMHNYFVTTETETIALSPKAPFIVAEGQIPKEYEGQWRTANSEQHSFLVYKPTSIGGQPIGAPQRNAFEPPIQAITNARLQSSDDIKATTGIYDAALGAKSNEQSGIAIQRRTMQAQTSNFHFIDNLSRAIRHAGTILVEIIPLVYDTAQAVRILGEDNQQEIVQINQIFQKKNGEHAYYDLSVGKYDVSVETGPSFATKRQEAFQSLMQLSQSYPQMIAIMGDLMLQTMDIPNAQALADRFKKTLAPGLADDGQQAPQMPPQAQQQMQQMSQTIDGLTKKLNEATQTIQIKQIEIESKERIEFAKLEQQAAIEMAKLQSNEALATFAHQMEIMNQRLGLLDINEPMDQDLNGGMPDQRPPMNEQQPTGGLPPGMSTGGQSPGV